MLHRAHSQCPAGVSQPANETTVSCFTQNKSTSLQTNLLTTGSWQSPRTALLWLVLAWWPGQLASAQHMEVQVVHRLACRAQHRAIVQLSVTGLF
jgi:hypothetical protein